MSDRRNAGNALARILQAAIWALAFGLTLFAGPVDAASPVNLKTAKASGVKVPESIMLRATKVIR